MEPDSPTAALVDVIYRDPNRVPSLSAQLFGGHLVNVETTTGERKAKEVGGAAGLALFGGKAEGQVKKTDDESSGVRHTRQPHNSDAIDVVSAILGRGQLHGGYKQAENGSVIRVSGTLYFFDPYLIRMASVFADDKKAKGEQYSGKQIKEMLHKLTIPPLFFIADGDNLVAGTMHESGPSEPISSFHIKHGGDGLPGVTLVGVKEVRSPLADVLPQMLQMMGKATRGLSDMLIPPDAIRVSPLCLYRELAR